MMHDAGSDVRLTVEDKQLIERIAEVYKPAPMTAARETAFRRTIEVRLESRFRFRGFPAFGLAAAAAVAVALWLGVPRSGGPQAEPELVERPSEDVTLYTFVDVDPDDSLPDDYVLLANALDVSVDDF
jgi:hypothetical protein